MPRTLAGIIEDARGPRMATERPFGLAACGRLHRRSRQGTGRLRAADSLFHAGIHGEDIDQAGDFQDTADLLLRGGQGIAGGPSPAAACLPLCPGADPSTAPTNENKSLVLPRHAGR